MPTTSPNKGKMVVLSAPSGTGKSTVCKNLKREHDDVAVSISYTTRLPRGREKEGREYRFVDEERFAAMVEADHFLEWAEVHGARYGSGRRDTERLLRQGLDVLFDIDVQGGYQIKRASPEAILIFLIPPSFRELHRRLLQRKTETAPVVEKRLKHAVWEIEQGLGYDFHVVNDDLKKAVMVVDEIRRGKLEGQGKQKELLKKLMEQARQLFETTS